MEQQTTQNQNENKEESGDLLSGIAGFNKSNLKPTTTVERHGTFVDSKEDHKGGRLGFGEDEDVIAYYDSPQEVIAKCKEIAKMIKEAKHVVAYTGAGISTSTGLPDYRSEETGVWTLRDKGLQPVIPMDIEKVRPSYSHMALVALMNKGYLAHVVSTNIDGLHLRSGVPKEKLSELHGNSYLEKCAKCKKQYLRSYDCTKHGCRKDHITGNTCDDKECGGQLLDNIVHFGENLPQDEFYKAELESRKGDVALVLGTSLRVAPANELPSRIYGKTEGQLILCNLQKTPFDERANIRIHSCVDDMLGLVLKELDINVDLNTPEGISAHQWVNRIEEIYPQKIKEMEDKIQLRKAKAPAKLTGISLNKNNIAIRTHKFIADRNFTKLEITDVLPNQLVFFKTCNKSDITLSKTSTKVMIEACKDSTFNFGGVIITRVLEIINCNDLTLNIDVPIFTVSFDNCQNVKAHFRDRSKMLMLVTTKCTGITIQVENETHEVKHDADGSDLDQYLTRRIEGKLLTELVLRECEGMFTTAREKALGEEAALANAAAMARYLEGSIKFSKKN